MLNLQRALAHVLPLAKTLLPTHPLLTPVAVDPLDKHGEVDDTAMCSHLEDFIQYAITNVANLKVNVEEALYAYRWADAAAATLDLFCAAHLIVQNAHASTAAAAAATAMRSLAHVLFSRSKPSSVAIENNEATEIPDSIDTDCDIAIDADTDAARTTYLQALALASHGNDEAALSTVLPLARARLAQADTEGDDAGDTAMYIAATLLLRRGGSASNEEAKRLAEACAARGYRKADALSIAARAARPDGALTRWRVVMSIGDARRPTALWLSARAMARKGMHAGQAQLLALLEDLLQELEEGVDKVAAVPPGVVRMPGGQDALEVHTVREERGRALCAAGRVEEGCKELQACIAGGGVEVAMARASLAPSTAAASTIYPDGVNPVRARWERIGLSLARAETALRNGSVDDAVSAVQASLRETVTMEADENAAERLLRAVCLHNMGVLKICLGTPAIADEWFAAAQTAFEKCVEENSEGGDEHYLMGEDARHLEALATFARCVTMWACGRREDGATHWVEKRGLQSLPTVELPPMQSPQKEQAKSTHDLACDVDDEMLSRMDAICIKVCRQMRQNSLSEDDAET